MKLRSVGIALVILGTFAPTGSTLASRAPVDVAKPALDVRLPATDAARAAWVMRAPTPVQLASADALRSGIPDLTLRWDGLSGAPKWIGAPAGLTLSPPVAATADAAARAFLSEHAALYGLTPGEVGRLRHASTIPGGDGGTHVHFAQTVSGLDVFGAVVSVNLRPDNAVLSVGATLFGDLGIEAAPALPAAAAVARAVRDVYPDRVFTGVVLERSDGVDQRTVFEAGDFAEPIEARLTVFPTRDAARLAWQMQIAEPTYFTAYLILIDAVDGSTLFRHDMILRSDARVMNTAIPAPACEEYQPDHYDLQPVPSVTPQSPAGWIRAPGTRLAGNNANGHLRSVDGPSLFEATGLFDFRFGTSKSSLVSAWWWANEAHDLFYSYGFDEASHNFQSDNFGLGGAGGDPIGVVMATNVPRNGGFGYFQAVDGSTVSIHFTWINCPYCDDHDGYPANGYLGSDGERAEGYDKGTVYHEYTHAVSTRLVGAGTAYCVGGTQSSALGEGWSDLFEGSAAGSSETYLYYTGNHGTFRSMSHNLTYADFCKVAVGCEEHGDGMIWGGALWDLRESMRALEPGDGLERLHRLLIEGMKGAPCNPDYLDARDALLQADTALYGSSHHALLWNVFAKRGMGQNASTTGDADRAPVPGDVVPAGQACSTPVVPTMNSAASEGDNAVRLSYSAPGAAALEVWRDDLYNPLDVTQRVAYTTDPASYRDATVLAGRSYRYHLVALGAAGTYCRSGSSATAEATASGACSAYPIFDPQLTISDGDSSCALGLSWSPALPGCPGSGAPIVYNIYRAETPGFEPFAKLLIGRTPETTFRDTPPQDGRTYYYLVLAQHGTLDDPVDPHDRGSSQVIRWFPRVPTLGRTTINAWGFESGAAGWTVDNANDPTGGWVLADPRPTRYENIWLAPPEAASGTMAWVTGDGPADGSIAAYDSDATVSLISPTWDGTGGATIVSFDYWTHLGWLQLEVHNGITTTTVELSWYPTLMQDFDTDAHRSWQRGEIDLASYVTPTSSMSIRFVTWPHYLVSEFGIDNVRVETATVCGRSGLRVTGVTVDDTQPGWGNGNGLLEPGETARLTATVSNDGTVTAGAPVATLRSGASGLLVHEGTAAFPDVLPGGSASSTGPGFTVTAPADRDCRETTAFEFDLADDAGTRSLWPWAIEFGSASTETIFTDTFATDKGWDAGIGFTGCGKWQRGVPVGTMDGTKQANPANDSPRDAGAQCYVTENGKAGDPPAKNDVDLCNGFYPTLSSPLLNFTGFKHVRASFDLWYYDNSASQPAEDFAYDQAVVDLFSSPGWITDVPTGGWVSITRDLSEETPLTADNRLRFKAYDVDPDSIVEMGVDNVKVVGDRQVCAALGVTKAPNEIFGDLRVGQTADATRLSWIAPPVDATHDAAAYYQVLVSNRPDGAFAIAGTTTGISSSRSPAPVSEFYTIIAVNAAGTSGDEPEP